MQMPRLPSPRTRPGVDAHEKHRSRWKLGMFTWPIWHGSGTADSLTPATQSQIKPTLQGSAQRSTSSHGDNPLPELFAGALLQECELHDAVVVEARRRLEALEADPETDELTLVIARHEVFMRKHNLAQAFTS
jgi:hypothetical protein